MREELKVMIGAVQTIVALDEATKAMWAAFAAGEIDEETVDALSMAVDARRTAIKARAGLDTALKRKAAQGPSLWLWARVADRRRSIERRRRLAASGPLPPQLAARFTVAEQAVLRIVGDECRGKGTCELTLGEIAARAGCGRTTAQNTMRLAALLGLVRIEERRRPWQRSLPNVVTVVSGEWRAWLARGPLGGRGGGFRKLEPTERKGSSQEALRVSGSSQKLPRGRVRNPTMLHAGSISST